MREVRHRQGEKHMSTPNPFMQEAPQPQHDTRRCEWCGEGEESGTLFTRVHPAIRHNREAGLVHQRCLAPWSSLGCLCDVCVAVNFPRDPEDGVDWEMLQYWG